MPELPEVEHITNSLKSLIINKKIKKIKIYNTKLKFSISKKFYYLKNQIILKIKRYSKYILIQVTKGFILIHLGMTGNIIILKKKKKINKYIFIDIYLEKNILIRYEDVRKFGFWLFFSTKEKVNKILNKLGPEPLTKNFNSKYLFNITKKRNICIHQLIMKNNILSGIGNIYSNESLFSSKILPYRKSKSLNYIEIKKLVKNIKIILKKAIIAKGTTIKNFKNTNENLGNFQFQLNVYGRKNNPCYLCSNIIKSIKKYNRSLFFCDKCQK